MIRLIDEMDAEYTAEWIRMLGSSMGWLEANEYAESFRENHITGSVLAVLTMESLKTDLGIIKFGHRAEIMIAIGKILPNNIESQEKFNCVQNFWGRNIDERNFGMVDSSIDFRKITGRLADGMSVSRQANRVINSIQHINEVKKWVKQGGDFRNRTYTSRIPVKEHTKTSTKGRRDRARPGNHVAYKALQDVPVKSGKAFSSSVVGQLLVGSIVLINQIKGRNGRMVQRNTNGELVSIGWVPLFTREGHKLLAKCWRKGGVKNSDATFNWKTKSPLDIDTDTNKGCPKEETEEKSDSFPVEEKSGLLPDAETSMQADS